jgi:hypothetical protein
VRLVPAVARALVGDEGGRAVGAGGQHPPLVLAAQYASGQEPDEARRPMNQVVIGGISSSTSAPSRFTSASGPARVNGST